MILISGLKVPPIQTFTYFISRLPGKHRLAHLCVVSTRKLAHRCGIKSQEIKQKQILFDISALKSVLLQTSPLA
jgi:hypothetical protein